MADDVATPSSPLVATIDKEELEEATLDRTPLEEVMLEVNVSQRPREKEPSKKVMRTGVDRSAWDRRLSLNPHALAIYLKFVHVQGVAPEGSKSANVKTTMFVFIVELGFPVMAIIVSCEAQSTPFPWSIELNT